MLLEYKEAGYTINQFIETIKKKYIGRKIAYAGRLDPMARGIIPILFDNECYDMNTYTNKNKIYNVKIMIGISTDSDDPLGLIQNHFLLNDDFVETINKNKDILINHFNTHSKMINQNFHFYSTKEINKRKKINLLESEYTQDSHLVELYESKIISFDSINLHEWIDTIINIIKMVDSSKNFRQSEIIKQWIDIRNLLPSIIYIPYIELQLNVSSGFFVRQFIRDTVNNINIPMLCYDIHRVTIY